MIARLILGITYGLEVDTVDNEYIKQSEDMVEGFVESSIPGRFLVDVLPSLKFVPRWFPFAGFQKLGAGWRKSVHAGMNAPFAAVKAEMAAGIAKLSLTSYMLEQKPKDMTDESLQWISGTLYGAGMNTMLPVFHNFILVMIHHPEIQEKARDEILRVVGSGRLPNLSDQESLPYLECILKEILRWQIVLPLSIPYRIMEDFNCQGYHIPKGATLMTNNWAITQDPIMYPNPDQFMPERFEGHPEVMDPRQIIFGYGRRICPGRFYAQDMLWITMATLLATSQIGKARNENGNEITPAPKYLGYLTRGPEEFRCAITPIISETGDSLLEQSVTHAS